MDNQYWDNYYLQKLPPVEPSQFARDILPHLERDKVLLDLGCGNGRDTLFFYQNGLRVMGIDQSAAAVEMLGAHTDSERLWFVQDNFVTSPHLYQARFDYIYSRFTLHSVTENEEDILLQNLGAALKPDGLLFIEARSVKDEIYGKGEAAGRNAYVYQGHYRRFLVLPEVVEKLQSGGLHIIRAEEKDNCAVYKQENPIVIRITAQKGEKA